MLLLLGEGGISVKPLDEKLRKRRREKEEILKEKGKETKKWKIREKIYVWGEGSRQTAGRGVNVSESMETGKNTMIEGEGDTA
jgi:hypothetical protein